MGSVWSVIDIPSDVILGIKLIPPTPFFIGLLVGDGTTNLKLDRS